MKKKIKIRVMTIILLAALLVGLLPASASASAAEYKTITTDEIKKKMDDYINYLNLSEECKVFWDQCLRSSEEQARLVNALDEYARTGNKELLKVGLTNTPCPLTAKTGKHRYETGGCLSNIFNGGAQCHGFGLYFEYYLHNAFVNGGTAYDKWTYSNASWESIGGLKPGDLLRVNGHTMIFHSVDANGLIKVVHANGHSSSKPCSVNFENPWYTNNSKYSEALCRQLFESGTLTITRYKYIVECKHNECSFRDNSMYCNSCGEEYKLTVTPLDCYMDIVAVNGTGTAPAHVTSYGSASVTNRYTKGTTVKITGVTKNYYSNTWYKTSTGYINEDYLSSHKCNNYANGYCNLCTAGLEVVSFPNPITLSVKDGSYTYHIAPYEASMAFQKNADKVSVIAKLSNGFSNVWYLTNEGEYVYEQYLLTGATTAYVSITWDTLALNNAPRSSANGSSKMLGEVQPYTCLVLYPHETVGNWYSVSVNGKVGYVYKKYVSIMETTKEIGGTNVSNTGTTSGTVTNLAATPTSTPTPTPTPTPAPKAKVLAPTNRNYTKKQYVGYTNAVLVSNIRKDAGTSVSAVGIDLFDAYGNLIKTYEENVVGVVGKNNTNFHSWFDVNKELRVNLSRRTTYNYRFYTIVDGQRYDGQMYSFTTK